MMSGFWGVLFIASVWADPGRVNLLASDSVKWAFPVQVIFPKLTNFAGNTGWVLERHGLLREFPSGAIVADFTDRVIKGLKPGDAEPGALSFTLGPYPDHPTRFYLAYVSGERKDPFQTKGVEWRLSEFPLDSSNGRPVLGMEKIILSFEVAGLFHFGGAMAWMAPNKLFVSIGDTSDGSRPTNLKSPAGKILLVEIESFPKIGVYAIGFRNPWRIAYDPRKKRLWALDVGHHTAEEINLVNKGGNYGWSIKEGSACVKDLNYEWKSGPTCGEGMGLVDPVYSYSHADGCAITGALIYSGKIFSEERGSLIYSDHCSGKIFSFSEKRGFIPWLRAFFFGSIFETRIIARVPSSVGAIAEKADGEILVLDTLGGRIFEVLGD